MSQSSGDAGRGNATTGELPLVVIVDDDASVRTSACRLIRSFGYRAEVFASGEELLSSPMAAETTCLLLDVRMPGMDGLEVQRRVIARGHVPVIFISGCASEEEERRARSAGAIDFLRKPVDTATLLQILQKVVSGVGGRA
jgi:FixJ family two-component response regulator